MLLVLTFLVSISAQSQAEAATDTKTVTGAGAAADGPVKFTEETLDGPFADTPCRADL